MIIYLYDGSFDGLYTAIFESYERKEELNDITVTALSYGFFDTVRNIKTDKVKAERVKRKLNFLLKNESKIALDYAFRSNDENKEIIIYNYVKKILKVNADISDNYSDASIYALHTIYEKVRKERHLFLGFTRFSLTEYGIYYAKIAPDNNIADLLLPHFKRRYSSMPFIIHDEKRNIFACYNDNKTSVFTSNEGAKLFKNVNDNFAKLFKKYYDTVNIKQRKNLKTMRNFLPTKYHANLPERNELL